MGRQGRCSIGKGICYEKSIVEKNSKGTEGRAWKIYSHIPVHGHHDGNGVSGFMVAGESMKKTYDNTFDKYNVEDGHFDLSDEASDNMKDNIEDEGVKLYDMSYYELPMSNIGSDSDGNSGNVEGNAETKDDTVNSVNDVADDGEGH